MADELHPFLAWLGSLEKGKFIDDAWEALRDVTRATAQTTKSSSFGLTFSIARYDLDEDGDPRRDVQAGINRKLSIPKRGHSTMFVTPDGGLARYDPRQSRFEFVMPKSDTAEPVPAATKKEGQDQ